MYGDTSVIRRLASDMDSRAGDLRATAAKLASSADTAHWWSPSAERMRSKVQDQAAALKALAADYEEAARLLRDHAREVDETKAFIAAIERRIHSIVEGALGRLRDAGAAIVDTVAGGVRSLTAPLFELEVDPEDVQLAKFSAPPPGDMAWLDVPDQLGVRV